MNIRPVVVVRDSVYTSRGLFEGIVKAFIPRQSRCRVTSNRLVRGLRVLYSISLLKEKEFRSTRPLNIGTVTT